MGVGGVKGGGKKGGVGGAKGAAGAKKGSFGDRVERAAGPQGASGVAGTSGAGAASATDPIVKQALDIVSQLKAGVIKSREEATRTLVADILKEKVKLKSRLLTNRIAGQLEDDPRLSQALERLWGKAGQSPSDADEF